MGFMEMVRQRYDMRKVERYTKRRQSQSQFQCHDRSYYEAIYRDGVYLDPSDLDTAPSSGQNTTRLSYKPQRWSLSDVLNKKKRSTSLAAAQIKTSETYTLGGRP
ncbi:uncharacterized protein BYT42DRAFT_489559 [Radiomyces spectabilis]|uniref:uncharacterized protein n=1 Tax=Radiomyces spectabilis TaxID=64574 RepID=UPI00221FEE54|nr:uncharacterized protein BYT42DRAFT_489559 [Radiomyces spectabilis]KAI8390951.1 hypothetical protein BYT42DRAFT_489559 [Radiomyces spectabilis]